MVKGVAFVYRSGSFSGLFCFPVAEALLIEALHRLPLLLPFPLPIGLGGQPPVRNGQT